jgi:hypothetical protein
MKVVNSPQRPGSLDGLQRRRYATPPGAPAVEPGKTLELEQLPAPLLRPLPGRYDLHRFWAQVGSLQQQATAVQITLRALLLVRQGLRDMLRLFAAVREAGSFKGWTTQLQEQKRLVARIPLQTHYNNRRLLTQAFRPALLGYQDIREFSIVGLNLLAPAGRDEHLELILLGGRPVRAGLSIKGDSFQDTRVRQVGRAFARVGIRSRVGDTGSLMFSVPIEQWKAVNGQLYIRGGGVRIPTGEPIKLQLEPDISWREIGLWKLGNEDDLELAERRIVNLDREIDSHFFLLQQMKSQWMGQLQAQPNDLGTPELEGLMGKVMSCFGKAAAHPLTLFTTQANVQRGTVQSILAQTEERQEEL